MTNRRRFLKRAGVVGVLVASAGCTGSQQGDGGGSNNDTNGDGGGGDSGDGGSGGSSNTNKNGTITGEGNESATDGGGKATSSGATTSTEAGGGGVTEVAAGPSGNLVFKPEIVEISVGGTVRWNFKSPGHNVSAKPDASGEVKLPQGAEPFASYPDSKSYQVVSEGKSYSHTFETPGKYVYICVPHVSAGMIGTVNVSK